MTDDIPEPIPSDEEIEAFATGETDDLWLFREGDHVPAEERLTEWRIERVPGYLRISSQLPGEDSPYVSNMIEIPEQQVTTLRKVLNKMALPPEVADLPESDE